MQFMFYIRVPSHNVLMLLCAVKESIPPIFCIGAAQMCATQLMLKELGTPL